MVSCVNLFSLHYKSANSLVTDEDLVCKNKRFVDNYFKWHDECDFPICMRFYKRWTSGRKDFIGK